MDGYAYLMIPVLVFALSIVIAFWLYSATAEFWRKTLDFSPGARSLFRITTIVVLPLVIAIFWGVIDISEIRQGSVSLLNSLLISVFLFLMVLYVYLHKCWYDVEEFAQVFRTYEIGNLAELDCQKDFLVQLLMNFRTCIGHYASKLREILDTRDMSELLSERIPDDLATDNIRTVVEAIRRTYQSIETVPKDYGVKVLLLESQDGYLVHRESFDGTNWDCQKSECDSHREQYFNLAKPSCSVAVASAVSKTIQIIESCNDCHLDPMHPFWYFQDCLPFQQENLGSMIAIPIEPENGHIFVLCVTCSQPRAFLKKHLWKAKTVQENLQPRIALLTCQNAILSSLCAESTEAQIRLTDLECKADYLEKELVNAGVLLDSMTKDLENATQAKNELSAEIERARMLEQDLTEQLADHLERYEELTRRLDKQHDRSENMAPDQVGAKESAFKDPKTGQRGEAEGTDGKGPVQ